MGYVVMRIGPTNADSAKAPGSVTRDCRAHCTLSAVVAERELGANHFNRRVTVPPTPWLVVSTSQPRPLTRFAQFVSIVGVASNPHSPHPPTAAA